MGGAQPGSWSLPPLQRDLVSWGGRPVTPRPWVTGETPRQAHLLGVPSVWPEEPRVRDGSAGFLASVPELSGVSAVLAAHPRERHLHSSAEARVAAMVTVCRLGLVGHVHRKLTRVDGQWTYSCWKTCPAKCRLDRWAQHGGKERTG